MNNRERRDAQLPYISDGEVFEEQKKCRRLLQKLNFMDRSDFDGIGEVVKELFGKSEVIWIFISFTVRINVSRRAMVQVCMNAC